MPTSTFYVRGLQVTLNFRFCWKKYRIWLKSQQGINRDVSGNQIPWSRSIAGGIARKTKLPTLLSTTQRGMFLYRFPNFQGESGCRIVTPACVTDWVVRRHALVNMR